MRSMPTVALVSFRLGGTDGVSVEAAKWRWAMECLGMEVVTVAGEGPVDHLVPGLAMTAPEPPTTAELDAALGAADLVVVENVCSLPLNPPAAARLAAFLRGRPAVLHHHDLPWERPHLRHLAGPPDDPAWRHVTISRHAARALARRGIEAATVYNAFDLDPRPGRRRATRAALGVGETTRLLLQPTRALPRKNVPAALRLAEAIDATYWLLGPPEDGYGPELDRLLARARCQVVVGRHALEPGGGPAGGNGHAGGIEDAYAASDLVVLPSTWEGFGNPSIEAAVHRRPLAVGPYPVAGELAAFGFEWFAAGDHERIGRWLAAPDAGLLERNRAVAERWFNLADLPARLEAVFASVAVPR